MPGNTEESLLFQAISGAQGVDRMPPKGALPAGVIADFRAWITMGAPDPRDGKAAIATAGGQAGPSDWWSLKPLLRPAVPRVGVVKTGWPANAIDAFILAKLVARRDWRPHVVQRADRRTLLRRLSFDLRGLPPEPEEVDAFENDRSADAYERLVERLLSSPHYGERSARSWMDLVHFAETHGHDQDRIRPNAWPYRDYLIASFNRDKPYGRFVAEQVAADALFPNEPELVVALGMLAAGPWDESSLRDIRDDSIDRQIGHYMDRDDMVSTVMSTFVSSTAGCARCHDHKFDPISQEDYYSLQAVFAGVDKAERPYDTNASVSRLRRSLGETARSCEEIKRGWCRGWISAMAGCACHHCSSWCLRGRRVRAELRAQTAVGRPRAVNVLRRGISISL